MSNGGKQRTYALDYKGDKKRLTDILEGPGPAKPKDEDAAKIQDAKQAKSIEAEVREAAKAANDARSEANAAQAERDKARRATSVDAAKDAAGKAGKHADDAFDLADTAGKRASEAIDDVAKISDSRMRQNAGAIVARALENAATAKQDSERADLAAKAASDIAASTEAWSNQTR